jgi:hypothetical protein
MPGGHHVFESVPRGDFVPRACLEWESSTDVPFEGGLVVFGVDVKQGRPMISIVGGILFAAAVFAVHSLPCIVLPSRLVPPGGRTSGLVGRAKRDSCIERSSPT